MGHTRLVALLAIVSAAALTGCEPDSKAGDQTAAPSALAAAGPANANAKPTASTLSITSGGKTQAFSADALLARSDVATITTQHDPAYGRPMTYRAVPLRSLLGALPPDKGDTVEMRATDGFVVQLPATLLQGAATPWIAVEDPAHPWPPLAGKTVSAGPFYLIWQDAERAGISPEQWPFALASMTAVASPLQRWPALEVAPSAPANAPVRRGQAVVLANCFSCHRLGGAGEGVVGPDLLRPMPATRYFTDAGLRALIRDPAAVRNWPEQHMPAFDAKTIPDSDIDAVIAYLHYLATHSPTAR